MRCRRLDAGDDVFLIADMDLRCYDLTHGSWLFLSLHPARALYHRYSPDRTSAPTKVRISVRMRLSPACFLRDTTLAAHGGGIGDLRPQVRNGDARGALPDQARLGSYLIVWLLSLFRLHLFFIRMPTSHSIILRRLGLRVYIHVQLGYPLHGRLPQDGSRMHHVFDVQYSHWYVILSSRAC